MNRLAQEKSPYLRQHAANPVDWYPWGEEAFLKARREDKPILVSIGYSTCHWCHVMERESFADAATAELMNRHLVAVKVDREERPDVDKIYMTAVTALTGQGGWPLNVFLTPGLKPFFGGTYFPPREGMGRISWPALVERVGSAWRDPAERKKMEASAGAFFQLLEQSLAQKAEPGKLSPALLERALQEFKNDFDPVRGGFGGAPKFAMPVNLSFLLRCHRQRMKSGGSPETAKEALAMALATLRAVASGGIRDHVGGGFHRYSTDEFWHLPHFEKMLYDNAQLVPVLLDGWQISKEEIFREAARETLDYLLAEMARAGGGFFSAQDADSLPPDASGAVHGEAQEGACYLWRKTEVEKVLGTAESSLFCAVYGIEENGNVRSDPTGEFGGRNVPYLALSFSEAASRFGKREHDIKKILAECKIKLLEVRRKRPAPLLDDKILASWNGLALSAFARGAQVLGENRYLQTAEESASFLRENLYDARARRLYHRWYNGERAIPGFADDYSFLIQGLIDLYETSFDPSWLGWALELARALDERFLDAEGSGFFMTESGHDKHLLLRVKEDYDNVEPSANSTAALNLLRLAEFTGRKDLKERAESILAQAAQAMRERPRLHPQMLSALCYALGPRRQIVVTGARGAADTQGFLNELRSRYLPDKILLLKEPGKEWPSFLSDFAVVSAPGGKAALHLCVDTACRLPVSDPETARKILDEA